MKRTTMLRVLPGGKGRTRVYRGHAGGIHQRIIVAESTNEAYALMLDALFGKRYEKNCVYTAPEQDEEVIKKFRDLPVGVYEAC